MPAPGVDPRTPVVIGVGQSSERVSDPGYRRLSPVGLAADAARAAFADTGADPVAVARAVDTVAGVRQFEISNPRARAPLGRSDNYPRSVARRVGVFPARAVLEVSGGQAPQHLVNELAGTIAAGHCEAVLIFGSEAISTVRHLGASADRPDFSETVEGELEDRGYGLEGLLTPEQIRHGLVDAPAHYGLLENARRVRLAQSRGEYARGMGQLFAPFTEVAAANPHAAAPIARTADELITVSERNRMIADPYPRFLVSRDQVNQGAAVVLVSLAVAERLGVPPERRVFLHGHADLRERSFLERPDLSAYPAGVLAVRHALDMAGLVMADVSTIDLYSCFPIAVSAVADGVGLAADDPRGLTVTGGLPFFGGAGNNYSAHAVAETVQRLRADPGAYGLVGANGGFLSKYSVGVYSTTPALWRPGDSRRVQARLDSVPARPTSSRPQGGATVETWTVEYGPGGARKGTLVGRLDGDGRRFLAHADDTDGELLDLLSAGDPAGERIHVRSAPSGNRASLQQHSVNAR
ncbi:acetyl-CoA acetyltransferase [Streptomyces sp. NPDC051985]|uniref:acetyl-CoA acetyltransferase n=1 Tax=Streptomyces sp. NPDC051985 TaxID=3155807 RepID=UPI0034334E33